MTKIEEIEQKLNELERELKNTVNAIEEDMGNEISELRGALAELKESKKEGKWKPKYGDTYWLRDTIGNFGVSEYCAGDCIEWRLNNIPLFKTEEECKRYWHFMDTVKEKSYEFSKEEWEDEDISKFYICYDYNLKIFHPSFAWACQIFGRFYFRTEDDAQYIIDNFKDELMEFFVERG